MKSMISTIRRNSVLAAMIVINVVAAVTIARRLEAQTLPCFLSFNCYCQSVESGAGFCGDGPAEGKRCYGNFMCGSSLLQ